MPASTFRTWGVSAVSALVSVATLLASVPAQAQYPARNIKLVVTNEAGTGPDLMARLLAASMSTSLGKPVVVENKIGANGNIATDYVAKSPADGYTLLLASDAQFAINPHVYAKLPFNPQTDFAPVATLGSSDLFLVVNPKLPAKDLKEFIEFAKKSPVPLNYGSPSSGTQHHLLMEMLKTRAGINLQHIPYKGGGAAAVAAVAGDIQVLFGGASAIPLIRSSKLRVLASSGPKRSAAFPDVPTVSEVLPGFEGLLWMGLFAPAGAPPEVLAAIRGAVQKFLASPETAEKLAVAGIDPYATTPERFRELIRSDYAKYGQLVNAAGVKFD